MRECDKHPIELWRMTPREFAKEVVITNHAYQKEFFKELSKEYLRQSEGDKKRGRIQLSSSLEELSYSLDVVADLVDLRFGEYKESVKNLSPRKLATDFGFTNYFYQRECFRIMNSKMPHPFVLISKSIENVCKSCKNYMKNPYE